MQSIVKNLYSIYYQYISAVLAFYSTRNWSTQTTLLTFDQALTCFAWKSCQTPLESVHRCIMYHWDTISPYYYG